MKLKRVVTNEKTERITVNMRVSVAAQLKLYREEYQKAYGVEISMGLMVEEIVRDYMLEDKDFQKFLANKTSAKAK